MNRRLSAGANVSGLVTQNARLGGEIRMLWALLARCYRLLLHVRDEIGPEPEFDSFLEHLKSVIENHTDKKAS